MANPNNESRIEETAPSADEGRRPELGVGDRPTREDRVGTQRRPGGEDPGSETLRRRERSQMLRMKNKVRARR